MKRKFALRKANAAIAVAALALTLNTPAIGGPIAMGVFQEFAFTTAGTPATGCDPADPAGPFCIPSSGTPTTFLNAPPWTFVAPAIGAILTVTDAFQAGDRFQIFDFGASLGMTSVPFGNANCGSDPVPCLATPGISNGTFLLAAGNHSLSITSTLAPSEGGVGYLRVDPVPEPGTWALFGAGSALAFWHKLRNRKLLIPIACLGLGAVLAFWLGQRQVSAQGPVTRFSGPTSSQPLALPADDSFLAVVNPDNNSVSFFDVTGDSNRRVAEVPVQTEPNGVAVLPDGSKAYVANTVSGTVSVIRLNISNGVIFKPSKHIPVGTEPYGLALTPNGTKLYVSNSRSDSVSVIDTVTDTVIKTITGVGPEPRGLAITNNGDAVDTDETVYVTQFLSLPVAGKVDGQDDAKAGHVTILSTATDSVTGQVTINPITDTGFLASGDAIARIPVANPPVFNIVTGAYPNQLHNLAIKGNFVYVPNVGASPNGTLRFDVNTHSLLSTINRLTATEAGAAVNMHLAVKNQTNPAKLFNTLPWAIGFKHSSNEGYVVIAASNIIIKVVVDLATGLSTVQNDPTDPTRVLQLKVGKNPRGIVINSSDTRAYVMNYVSRDISVLDLVGNEKVLDTKLSANLPAPGTLADTIQVGKELYNTSVGVFDPPPGSSTPIVGRMSQAGWGACATCHPNGLSDDVVWIFPSGPKRTIPQHTDFDQTDPTRTAMRPLNWSAERDEEEDFELNIRAVSGGLGLIVLADGITQDPMVFNLRPLASANRNQLKVHGVNAWDAIKAYVRFGIRAPISPVSKTEPAVIAGRALFISANCQSCHGTAMWTTARIRFTPPPDAALVDAGGELFGELRSVDTFNPAALNEVRTNPTAPPLGANGFVPPSLLSIFAFPQTFFHNGSAASLDEVMNNVTHRSAGTGGVDTLTSAFDRANLVRFLLSIDATSAPIP